MCNRCAARGPGVHFPQLHRSQREERTEGHPLHAEYVRVDGTQRWVPAVQLFDVVLLVHLRSLMLSLNETVQRYYSFKRALSASVCYPDATKEELKAYDDTCAICREPLDGDPARREGARPGDRPDRAGRGHTRAAT